MKLYPLVFSFRDLIAGNGYVATVAMDGRVVLSEDETQETWMFGVQPGGIAGGDRQKAVALKEFKTSYLSVLYDIAAEATSFDQFKNKVMEFFGEVNAPNLADWNQALAEVRGGTLSLPDFTKVKSDARMPNLTIEKVAPERVNSGVNEFDQISEAA